MLFGLDLSVGWQWAIWWALASFLGASFYMLFISSWKSVQGYETAWWNRGKGLWFAIGGMGGLILGVTLSGSLVAALVRDPVVFKGTYRSIKSTFPGNPVILSGVETVQWAGMSFVLLVAYLGGTPGSKTALWVAKHFNISLVLIFLCFVTLRLLGIYLNYKINRSVVLD